MIKKLEALREEVKDELVNDILPFWMNRMTDREQGGFYGRIDGNNCLHPDAPKGAILNARILWTFSAAFRLLKKPEYLETATRAKRYLLDFFYDKQYGGIFWELNADGTPSDVKKQIYALGFAIYGLSEYARATGDREALEYAVRLFEVIEKYSFDPVQNGYVEALTREWQLIQDMRLSDKDENEKKTMNTHLHILEPYANLYRVWKDERLEKQLRNLIKVFVTRILDAESGHLNLFFEEDWSNKYHIISYGHDIEASWLIHEAALVLGDQQLLAETEPVIVKIARAADEGLNRDGSMIYENFVDKQKVDRELHWWVQAENVVGHINLYQYFHDEDALHKALKCWQFIKENLIDGEGGEWYWSRYADGTVNRKDDKAGFWKCPYHNGRMCMEIIERFS
ncbi:AGE family epimerase/isomerase [Bacteroides gallinaceum]|uniref:Cellobiose 2-epimerase n=1 Tax=Bacteroides gallinaceum TaxID=1462571 RepID=A0ABT7VE38_9BACE|nr:AGE family epimerase/isomerase [Bacteroides gallinaceum]MDM8207165.1 AGE family epimerase/isomerase [Bacteroides gallinaceum]MDM8324562.1 AGE family epimerase/isomerase [Bacteroides gallinaceum]